MGGNALEIRTERLVLRPFRESDAEELYQNYGSDPEVGRYISFTPCETLDSTKEFIKMHLSQDPENPDFYGWAVTLADADDKEAVLVGSASLFNVDRVANQCELGFSIGSRWWGMGIATEAENAIVQYALHELGFHRVYASHHVSNIGSGRVLQKIGMQYEGTLRDGQHNKDGSYSDLKLYAILETDPEVCET